MPIYDYLCTSCDHRADILHGINDPGPNFCPSCGAEGTMRKQFSAPTIHFKGSGWAKKDRGGASGAKASPKPSTSSSSDVANSTDSSPSAPPPPSESKD
jgi:putative FmdB family regulatory protein